MEKDKEEEYFTLVQQKTSSVKLHALCTKMDLIALLSYSGVLTVNRIFSWEKVYSASSVDLCGGSISSLCFSINGKVLAVGSTHGIVCLIDLEKGSHIQAHRFVENEYEVCSLHWIIPRSSDINIMHLATAAKEFGGLNLKSRVGMMEWKDIESGDDSSAKSVTYMSIYQFVHGTILISQLSNNHLILFACGIYPIYEIVLPGSMVPHHYPADVCNSSTFPIVSKENNTVPSKTIFCCIEDPYVMRLFMWNQHKAFNIVSINSELTKITELTTFCGRKWNDALKPIAAKLTLLKSSLKAYELPYTPAEFLYSISLCGIWHPAAQSMFTSNWNEQGLQRLKAAVESTSKEILKLFQLTIIPITNNILLRGRELCTILRTELRMIEKDRQGQKLADKYDKYTKTLKQLTETEQFCDNMELVLMKLEEAFVEARIATRDIKLYLDFIKMHMNLCNLEAANVDNALMEEFPRLFDPRLPRAAESMPEYVTGSYFFAHFLDKDFPGHVREFRKQGLQSTSEQNRSIIKNILSQFDRKICDENSLSLTTQLKITKINFQTLFQDYCIQSGSMGFLQFDLSSIHDTCGGKFEIVSFSQIKNFPIQILGYDEEKIIQNGNIYCLRSPSQHKIVLIVNEILESENSFVSRWYIVQCNLVGIPPNSVVSDLKLYVSSPIDSSPIRLALVGSFHNAQEVHYILKAEVLDVQFRDIDADVCENLGFRLSQQLALDIVDIHIKTRKIGNGRFSQIQTCASRGLVTIQLDFDYNNDSILSSLFVIDLEEDEFQGDDDDELNGGEEDENDEDMETD